MPTGDLDDAVLDRMDEALEFGLPRADERHKMLALYLDKWVPGCCLLRWFRSASLMCMCL